MLSIRQSESRQGTGFRRHTDCVFPMKIRGLKMGLYLKVQLGQSDRRPGCAAFCGGAAGKNGRVGQYDSARRCDSQLCYVRRLPIGV